MMQPRNNNENTKQHKNKNRKTKDKHRHNSNYITYNAALANFKKADSFWVRVINDKASEEQLSEFYKCLDEAYNDFTRLAYVDFLSANSYLSKIDDIYLRLNNKYLFKVAMTCLKDGDAGKNLKYKRLKYLEAEFKFYKLGNFQNAGFYAKEAKYKYNEVLRQSSPRENNSSFFSGRKPSMPAQAVTIEPEPLIKPLIYIENGYDLCIRPCLPSPHKGVELHTTTIITPDGAYQLDETNRAYVRVLGVNTLKELGLDSYLKEAKKLKRGGNLTRTKSITDNFEPAVEQEQHTYLLPGCKRRSIKTELTPQKLGALNAKLLSIKARSLEAAEEKSPSLSSRTN